jgi:hypothetical protein
MARLDLVARYFGRQGPDLNFLPGPVWTRDSLRAFQEEHLAPRRLGFTDVLRYAPWEAAWVGEWEFSRGCPGRFIADPYFLHFASDEAILHARASGVTRADVARRYLGIALAADHQEIMTF